MMKRLEKENIVMEPIATYENTDLLKDVHSLTPIQYLISGEWLRQWSFYIFVLLFVLFHIIGRW